MSICAPPSAEEDNRGPVNKLLYETSIGLYLTLLACSVFDMLMHASQEEVCNLVYSGYETILSLCWLSCIYRKQLVSVVKRFAIYLSINNYYIRVHERIGSFMS